MATQSGAGQGYYAEDVEDFREVDDLEADLDDEEIEALDDDEAFAEDDDEAFAEDDDETYAEDDDEIYAEDDDETYAEDDDEIYAEDDDETYAEDDDEGFDVGYAAVEGISEAGELATERNSYARRRAARRRLYLQQQARKRALARRKAARSAQRVAAQGASRVQKMLNRKLRKIRGQGRLRLRAITPAKGSKFVIATLANGRRTKMMFTPTLATATDVNRLTRQISANDTRQARAIQMQSKTIGQLKSAQSSAIKSLTAQQVKSTKDLTKRITAGDTRLDKRISKEVIGQRKAASKHDAQMLREIQHRQRRSLWNSVLIATSVPLWMAYGDRAYGDNGNPITKKNVILASSTLGWLFFDDIMDRVLTSGGKVNKTWRRGANIWNILAVAGNAATVYYFMKDKQHQRFITGVTKVTGNAESAAIALPVAKDFKEKFDNISDPKVVATIQSSSINVEGVKAKVKAGKLYLTLTGTGVTSDAAVTFADIAWAVDTLHPDDQRKVSTTSS